MAAGRERSPNFVTNLDEGARSSYSEDPTICLPKGRTIHSCSFCNYKSTKSLHVKNHIRFKHTGERPFPCSVCPSRFALKTDLQRHFLTHTGEKPFQCMNCLQRFRYKSSLKKHFKRSSCPDNTQ